MNNVTKIQNLQRCESLKKLDLTINFVSKAGLLTVESLRHNIHLEVGLGVLPRSGVGGGGRERERERERERGRGRHEGGED